MKIATCRVLPGKCALTDTRVYREGQTFEYELSLAIPLKRRGLIEITRTRDKADGRVDADARLVTAGTKTMLADSSHITAAHLARWRRR